MPAPAPGAKDRDKDGLARGLSDCYTTPAALRTGITHGHGQAPAARAEAAVAATSSLGSSAFENALAELLSVHRNELRQLRLAWKTEVQSLRCEMQHGASPDKGVVPAAPDGDVVAAVAVAANHRYSFAQKLADAPVELESSTVDGCCRSFGFDGDAADSAAVTLHARSGSNSSSHMNLSRRLNPSGNVPNSHRSGTPARLGSSTAFDKLVGRSYGLSSIDGTFIGRTVGGVNFELASMATICCFCVVTAIELQGEGLKLGYDIDYPKYSDNPAESGWKSVDDLVSVLSFILGMLFGVEVLMRALGWGRKFFYDFWNYLDVLILVGWGFELAGQQAGASRVFRPVRLIRMLRFVRMVKYIRHMESLYFMVQALAGGLKILGWSFLLLFSMQMLTAFVINEILSSLYFGSDRPVEEYRDVFEYFGSFTRSLLSTFEMAMANWPTPARVLFENVSEWFLILFLAHRLVVGFAILGIINAMFVQETFQVASTDDLTMVLKKDYNLRMMKGKLDRLFKAADTDNDERVDRNEFRTILEHQDVKLWLASMDYDPKDPDFLFDMLDVDGTGDLSCVEFLQGMTSLRGQARSMDLLTMVMLQNQIVTDLRGVMQQLQCVDMHGDATEMEEYERRGSFEKRTSDPEAIRKNIMSNTPAFFDSVS